MSTTRKKTVRAKKIKGAKPLDGPSSAKIEAHKKRKRAARKLETSVHRLVKKVAPGHSISARAMKILVDVAENFCDRLLDQAESIHRHPSQRNSKTLKLDDMETASQFLFADADRRVKTEHKLSHFAHAFATESVRKSSASN